MSRICAFIQQLESAEFVADFVATAGAVATDDEDDKTISQKDDKHIKCALSAPYLALSRSNSQSAKFVQYLCVRNAKILTLGILKTSFSLHSLNRIIALEITKHWPARAVNNLRAREL